MQEFSARGWRPGILRQLLGFLFIASLTVAAPPASAETGTSIEAQVKAAIVVKLAKFVDWPQSTLAAAAPLTICLIGETPLFTALTSKEHSSIRDHELKILSLASASERSLTTCQVLFLGFFENTDGEAMLNRLMRYPILTVSDIPGFAKRGGMVELVRTGGRVGFNINLGSVKKAGIAISSQVLDLATVVE